MSDAVDTQGYTGRESVAHHLARRAWLVLALSALAGLVAFVLVRDDPKVYERTLTFVILPSPSLEPRDVPDAMRSLAQQSSQTSGTIASAIGSARTLARATNGRVDEGLEITAGVRPGSDVVVVRLRGLNGTRLAGLAPGVAAEAARWVRLNLSSYRLSLLETEAPPGPVLPKVFEVTAVAALLAGVLALALAYFEVVRARRRHVAIAPSPGATAARDPSPEGRRWGRHGDHITVVRPGESDDSLPDSSAGSAK